MTLFGTILADPPWKEAGGGKVKREAPVRLACREDQLTWTLRQRLAEAKPELVELLRERVPN